MQLARYEESNVRISGDEIAVAYVKENRTHICRICRDQN